MSEFNKYRLKGAYHYDWYETEDWYKWLVDRCVKFCKGSRDTLDIGCGDGLLCTKLCEANPDWYVTGIDTDPYAIELAVNNICPGCYIERLSVYNIDEFDRDQPRPYTWDYMTCLNVIEHLDRPEVIRDIIRDRVEKGAIITTIDYQGGPLGEDHKFEWTMDEMMEFFKEFNPKPFRYKDTEWIGVEIRK